MGKMTIEEIRKIAENNKDFTEKIIKNNNENTRSKIRLAILGRTKEY